MPDKKPICGILAGEPEIIGERCADGATCHHRCAAGCWRRTSCAPLSGSGLRYDWSPVDPSLSGLRDAAGDRFEVPVAWLSGPAEAEGVEVVAWQQRYICPDEGPSRWQSADERTVEILRRRDDYELRQLVPLTALSAVTAERDRLLAEVESLRKDAERYRWASSGLHEAETLASIVHCHGGYAEKVAERVDVYREAAMAAKDPEPENQMDAKVKAAALTLAEIERLDRAGGAGSLADGCRGIAGLDHRFTPGPFSGARYCSKCGVAEDPDAARAAMRTYLGLDSEDA